MDVNRGRAGVVHAWCAHACRIRDCTPWFPVSLSRDLFPWGGILLSTCLQALGLLSGRKWRRGSSWGGGWMLLCSSKGSFHNCSSQVLKLGCMLLGYRQLWCWRSTCLDLWECLLVHQLWWHLELSLKFSFQKLCGCRKIGALAKAHF